MQRLDSLLPRDTCLRHDELDVLGLQTRVVDLLSVIFVVVFLRLARVDGFAFAFMRVVVAGVGVAGGGAFLLRQLLDGRGLGLGVEVFDFGFTEDTGGVLVENEGLLEWSALGGRTYIQVLLVGDL